MSLFAWRDEYSVHHAQIDIQHKGLFRLADELHSGMVNRAAGPEVVARALAKLIDYTRIHFLDEEKLMRTSGFPDFAGHKAEHDSFAGKVSDLQRGLIEGNMMVTIDTLHFLQDWLSKHIRNRDQEIARHIARAAARQPNARASIAV